MYNPLTLPGYSNLSLSASMLSISSSLGECMTITVDPKTHKRQPSWNKLHFKNYFRYSVTLTGIIPPNNFLANITIFYIFTFPRRLSFSFRNREESMAETKTLRAPRGVTKDAGANA